LDIAGGCAKGPARAQEELGRADVDRDLRLLDDEQLVRGHLLRGDEDAERAQGALGHLGGRELRVVAAALSLVELEEEEAVERPSLAARHQRALC